MTRNNTREVSRLIEILTRVLVTYANDATRQLISSSTNTGQLIFDFVYLGAFAIIFTTMGIMLSWRYLSR